MPKVFLVFHRFPDRKRSDVHSFKGREIEVRLAAVLTKDEPTTQLLVQPRDRTTHYSPLLPIVERKSRFNRSPAASLLTASFQRWPAIPSIGSGCTSTAASLPSQPS